MDEIKKHNKHSIRDLKIDNSKDTKPRKRVIKRRKRGSGWFSLSAAGLLFLASIFVLYVFLKPVEGIVEISVKEKNVNLDGTLIHLAYKTAEDDNTLVYSIREYDVSAEKVLKAESVQEVSEKAKGTLIVYNEFTKPQRIIRNTRFEAPNGNIYRSKTAFTIPAAKGGEPGSTEVTVYADEAGEEYNINEKVTFTLPALKGEAARKIYAKNKGPIKGGFKGQKATVSDATKEKAIEELKQELLEQAYRKAVADLSEAEITFKDAIILKFNEPEIEYLSDGIKLKLSAKAYVPVFNKYKFAKTVISEADAELARDTERVDIYIQNPEDLEFALVSKDTVDLNEDEFIKFTLKGNAKVRYYLDIDALKQALAGKDSAIVTYIKEDFPAIKEIKAYVRPVWRDKMPEDVSKIQIIEK